MTNTKAVIKGLNLRFLSKEEAQKRNVGTPVFYFSIQYPEDSKFCVFLNSIDLLGYGITYVLYALPDALGIDRSIRDGILQY